jgi:hypothetical protein
MTASERADLADADDGDPGETVWYIKGRTLRRYHEDRQCQHLIRRDRSAERTTIETTRAGAKRRFRAPCRVCVFADREKP